jgi:iron complex transport system ATP-binding protein
MIKIENLCAGYGGLDIITEISASAKRGSLIALVGPNGCGKSTLIKTLAGIIAPSTGEIHIGGKALRDMPARNRAKMLSYLSQTRFAAPGMSGRDVVTLGRAPHRGRLGKLSHEGHAAVNRAMDTTHSRQFHSRLFSGLSGGEQARILLARALAVEAPILLADEPIAALDPFYQITMMEQLKHAASNNHVVIAALHDLALAHQFADQVWVMNSGHLVANDAPRKALSADILGSVFGISPPKGGFQPVRLKET